MTEDRAPVPGDATARALADLDALERVLRDIIAAPHWRVSRGKLVVDGNGNPVPDPRPARRAQRHLDALARRRRLLTGGTPWP